MQVWTPQDRQVVVHAYLDVKGEPHHDVYPVLGMMTVIPSEGRPYHEELIRVDNFILTLSEAEHDYLLGSVEVVAVSRQVGDDEKERSRQWIVFMPGCGSRWPPWRMIHDHHAVAGKAEGQSAR